ncbi:MAG: ATP synthase subunit I [Lysobacter sp.]
MHDPVAVGRRSAYRALAIQACVATLVALAFLVQGPRQAVAAAVGGGAMLLGNALVASLALGGGIQPARAVFARLVLGTLAKWAVVLGVLAFAFGSWRLSPLPALVGVMAGVLANLLGLNFGRVKRER